MKLTSRILLGLSALLALGFVALVGVKMASPTTVEGSLLGAWGMIYTLMIMAAIFFAAGIVLMFRSRSDLQTTSTQTSLKAASTQQTPLTNPAIPDWEAPKAEPDTVEASIEVERPRVALQDAASLPGWSDARTPVPPPERESTPHPMASGYAPASDDEGNSWGILEPSPDPWAGVQNTPEPFAPEDAAEPIRPPRAEGSQPTPKVPQPVSSQSTPPASQPLSSPPQSGIESALSSSGPARSAGPDSDSAFQAAPWMIQPAEHARPPKAETPPQVDTATSSDKGKVSAPGEHIRARLSQLRDQLDPAESEDTSLRVSSTGGKPYKSSLRRNPDNAFDVPTRRVGNAEIADVVSRSERPESRITKEHASPRPASTDQIHGLPRRPFNKNLGDLGPAKLNALWEEYIEANHACGRDLSRLKPATFYKHLAQNYKAIIERFNCSSVRFNIKTKDNRVSLQAIPIRRKSRS